MAILQVEDIQKRFGRMWVLEGISFSLGQGQTMVIIGSSGPDKTILLRCLNFLEQPDRGHIVAGGEVLFDASDPVAQWEGEVRKKRLHFGLVFQLSNLFSQYTALEDVALTDQLPARERSGFKGEKRRISTETEEEGRMLLVRMSLADRMGHYPHQFSGGQQQWVAIAQALALSPDIPCFDGSTFALDPELTGEALRVIRALAEQKTTMIAVTHKMASARDMTNQVVFMDGSMIMERGDARQVTGHPQERRIRQFLTRYSEN